MANEGVLSGLAGMLGFGKSGRSGAPIRTEAEIRQWMTERLARQLKVAVSDIDAERKFDAYGLDSRTAIQVSGELEKAVERRLSPALLIEHRSINAVARELSRELSHETSEE
jgi:acyl carrier protein